LNTSVCGRVVKALERYVQ